MYVCMYNIVSGNIRFLVTNYPWYSSCNGGYSGGESSQTPLNGLVME